MKAEEVKELYDAEPFKPFGLKLRDGTVIGVFARELIGFYPDREVVHVLHPKGPGQDVDLNDVIELTTNVARKRAS